MNLESKLDKAQKMVIILMLLDIIEMYSMEALAGTKNELKQAIKRAVQANKLMTRVSSKYLTIAENEADGISEDFGNAADFIKDMIEAYYSNEVIEEDGYYKFRIQSDSE
jgi:hypothetical protein